MGMPNARHQIASKAWTRGMLEQTRVGLAPWFPYRDHVCMRLLFTLTPILCTLALPAADDLDAIVSLR